MILNTNSFEGLLDKKELKKFIAFYEVVRGFFDNGFIVDCCCGNSFLGFYWLLQNQDDYVISFDLKSTERSKKVRRYFKANHPGTNKRYSFRQQDITDSKFEFPENSLVLAVHACGSLTDIIIKHCVSQNLPLAVMPCCYNSKRIWWKNDDVEFKGDLGHYIDALRLDYLRTRYKNTALESIDKSITPKNRIILATN